MILICFVLTRLTFARSKRLTVWDLKEGNRFNCVLSLLYTLVDNHVYKHVWRRRYHRYGIQRTIATSTFGPTRCSRLVYTWTTGHVGGTVGRRVGSSGWYVNTLGMTWEVSRTVFRSWMLPLMGVEITLIDCAHQLFTYPNEFLVVVGHRGSDKQGSTVGCFWEECSVHVMIVHNFSTIGEGWYTKCQLLHHSGFPVVKGTKYLVIDMTVNY